jgi:GT2 family glycosyltransferase/glycosyltransferase involved in cell wall biosynthesis
VPIQRTTSVTQAAALLGDAPSPLIVVPVYNGAADVTRCLESILRTVDSRYAILVVDDASTDPATLRSIDQAEDSIAHRVVVLRHEVNAGFVGSCNDAFQAAGRRDVVLVNSDVVVAPEWLERLVAAAASANTVATVSTLTNHGTIVSVPHRNSPVSSLPDGLTLHQAAERVAAAASRSYPVLPTGVGHCLYVTRLALDLLGGFDPVFAPGYGEEVDFCQRAVSYGLINVLADDVFVFHRGGGSFGTSPAKAKLQRDHEQLINQRYPLYESSVAWAATGERTPLAMALSSARRALAGMRIAVDGRCLGSQMMGTQRFTLETAAALSELDDVREVHLFVGHRIPDYVERVAAAHPRLVVRPTSGYGLVGERFEAAVRPYQVDAVEQLGWMRDHADVVVVTQLDLIAYHNSAYFGSPAPWRAYRDVTQLTFDVVDGVAFISEFSRAEAVREGLLGPQHHSAVTYCGVDHEPLAGAVRPGGDLREHFVLVLGVSYLHKNRAYALRLWAELRRRGYQGQIVLVGATPPNGNSLAEEASWQMANPALAADVVMMHSVPEDEKAWLLQHADLVVYPTLVEGFGMVPFEAAAAGAPVLSSRQGSLDEILPKELDCMPSMLPADAVALAEALINDPTARESNVAMLREAAEQFTWQASAASLVDLVQRCLDRPAGRRVVQAAPLAPAHQSPMVDRVVDWVHAHPQVHELVARDGSVRQRYLRSAANYARRGFRQER